MKFTLAEVFGGAYDGHECCSCCAGYCSLGETFKADEPAPETMYRITSTTGIEYISDRYVAIRADLVDVGEYADRIIDGPEGHDIASIPDAEPEDSTAVFRAAFVHHMKNCGIRIREGVPAGPQHLYASGEHVGWLMPANGSRPGPWITLDQVSAIKKYVVESKINGWAVLVGSGDDWDIAASILNEAKRIQDAS